VRVDIPLLDQLRRFLAGNPPPAGGVVIAVSGGPDSVALLRALAALRVAPLTVAHLNHQLRGPESDADETFVRQLHAALAATCPRAPGLHCARLDVATAARAAHDNLESTARRLRYDWLARVAQETGSGWVVTGHTADDQAETVLHRLLRGTGLQGLRGIAPRRPLAPGVELVRPLLAVPRSEVHAYLEAEGQPFRRDSSNDDRRLTRNRIRHELLPYLAEHYNPAIARVLTRLAVQAEEVCRDNGIQVRRLLQEVELPRAGVRVVLDRNRLAAVARHHVRDVFRLLWEREGWPAGRMTFHAWDQLADLTLGQLSAIDLPGGIQARARERVVQVGRAE